MSTENQDSIAAGQAALRAGDWAGARTHFEAALKESDSPAAHDGLGIALWWLNEIDAAHEQRTAAYVGYKQQNDWPSAAFVAAWLAREHVFLNGNASAMKGWFALADRALSQAGDCVEAGWLKIFRASMLATPAELEQTAVDTIRTARRFHDPALETFALVFEGMAQVALGRVAAGMQCVDEAMAAVTSGEVANYMTISEVFCITLSACELAGDLERTEHWCRAAADFAQRHSCPFLSAYCRTTYGSLLTAIGRWQEAESALTEAIRAFEAGHRGLRVHALLKLAELHVLQGRLEAAEVLLTGYEDDFDALIPRARLHLARGEVDLARTLLEQSLGQSEPPTMHQVPVFLLLVEVLLIAKEAERAQAVARQLAGLAQHTGGEFLLAQAELASGRVSLAMGASDAVVHLRAALERLQRHEQSLLAARIRLEMAYALKATDRPGAVTWARAAHASFNRIGAAHDAEEALKLLRDLGVSTHAAGQGSELLTQRETVVMALLAQGLTNREIGKRLYLSDKTVEHHVSHILSKLGVRTRAEAIAAAARNTLT